MDTIDKVFNISSTIIRSLPKEGFINVDVCKKLKFYALYKVATVGINSKTKPSIWNFEERQKWKEWKKYDYLDPQYAKYLYCKEFAETLRDLYQEGNSEYYIENGDFSIFKHLTENDIQLLMDTAINNKNYALNNDSGEELDDNMKKLMLIMKNKVMQFK